MKKILLLSFFSPLENDNGSGLRSGSLLLNLLELGYDVDIFAFANHPSKNIDLSRKHQNIGKVKFINKLSEHKLIAYVKTILQCKPMAICQYINEGTFEKFKEFIKNEKYDIIIVDYLYMYEFIKEMNIKYVLYEHNAEFIMANEIAHKQSNFLKKAMKFLSAFIIKKYEMKASLNANSIIHTSQHDINMFPAFLQHKMHVIPNTIISERSYSDFIPQEDTILFVGDLAHFPNAEGILWFIENVWSRIRILHNSLNLLVVGKNASDNLKTFDNQNGIRILGYVEDLNQVYKVAKITIAPINIGAGSRLKIIDSMIFSTLCISSIKGVEGLENCYHEKQILIADTVEEWITLITFYLINNSSRQEIEINAFEYVYKNYHYKAYKNLIQKYIEDDKCLIK